MYRYEENGEWEIIDTTVTRQEFHFECCPHERFSNIAFTVALRRRPEFYVMNVILPGILTSAVLLSIFYCTPTQKVHIGSAALLSFRLFLLNVVDTVPRTSDHVPLLGQ
jgi:nicotinic acetylcholine receptor, invertebrate